MKATGIVRRMDDLGRVVIPKEIRRTMRMKEGDPLEIYVDREGEVILKKYSPMISLGDFSSEIAEALSHTLKTIVLISDRDAVVAVGGGSKQDYLHRGVGTIVENAMEERRTMVANRIYDEKDSRYFALLEGNGMELISCFCIAPILPGGDVIGSVIILSEDRHMSMGEMEQKLAETAAGFLARQLEH